ncbi:hypothetical protein EON77_09110, partial [bacterium]
MTPSLPDLLNSGLLTPPTKAAFEGRLTPPAPGGFFTPEELARLTRVVEALRPDLPGYDAPAVAARIDDRLIRGEGKGWRYDELPPDGEAYRQGLAIGRKLVVAPTLTLAPDH